MGNPANFTPTWAFWATEPISFWLGPSQSTNPAAVAATDTTRSAERGTILDRRVRRFAGQVDVRRQDRRH